jgi:heme-degrading monooxygenase HmoA
MITELRTYKLKKGTSETFEEIFTEQSLPML